MREIKFRSISELSEQEMDDNGVAHQGKFVFGVYNDGYMLSGTADASDDYYTPEMWCAVKPETVGEYVGIKDLHGKEIYEGHILKAKDRLWQVVFERGMFQMSIIGKKKFSQDILSPFVQIVGDVHSNPELLEVHDEAN